MAKITTAAAWAASLMGIGLVLASAASADAEPISCETLHSLDVLQTPGADAATMTPSPSGCRVGGLVVGSPTDMVSWLVDDLDVEGNWEAPTGGTALTDAPPPTRLKLEARGIRQQIATDDARTKYIVEMAQRPMAVDVDYTWDRTSGAFDLRDLALRSPSMGRASVSLRADVPGDLRVDNWQRPDIRLKELHVELDNSLLVESMAIPPLVSIVPDGTAPADFVDDMKRTAAGTIAAMPDDVVGKDAKDALTRFVEDFPHPSGHFEASVALIQPVGMIEAMMVCRAPPFCLKTVTARYEPAED